ncbi:MAG: bifunctional UDP-N-acetylmuramoyl-tripeptide:D-alanyl-D-alanine ligase/alanine racemase [Bacteroidota bacterium]
MLGISYDIKQVANFVFPKDLFQGQFPLSAIKYVVFDTRNISHGRESIFVALGTSNRNGHDFVEVAYQKGVRNFILENPVRLPDINYLLVENSLETLQLWAKHHRQQFSYPVIGITGSNGKTIVKEWLATLLEGSFQLVKSPMSYNSQLGVAISLLSMRPGVDLAIIEAGISQPGEMELLAEMIQPDTGILTHMGAAHAEGFESFEQKLAEKCFLFEHVQSLWCGNGQPTVLSYLNQQGLQVKTVGLHQEGLPTNLELEAAPNSQQGWDIHCGDILAQLPISGNAALENAALAIAVAQEMGVAPAEIRDRILLLHPVEMRTELITDNPEVSIINDSYNSDVDSIRNAFQMLHQQEAHPRKCLILSDMLHQGTQQEALQQEILDEAEKLFGEQHIWTVGTMYAQLRSFQSYATTQELVKQITYEDFKNSTVLLKGARQFAFEQLIPFLSRRLNATYLEIDLNALKSNLRTLRNLLPEGTKVMCMVKAFSYGSGTWEIAQVLERESVEYLSVAYLSEGILLREKGIGLPIMVNNPDINSLQALIAYDLEPQVYSFDLLEAYIRAARLAGLPSYPLHLKLDTGMSRLGFQKGDIDQLIEVIGSYPDIRLISVLSHLAAADDPAEASFCQQQFECFDQMVGRLQAALGVFPFRHMLNTAGVLQYPERNMEMVRLGIGLYGINPLANPAPDQSPALQEIGTLHSVISQIHTYPAGTTIGYGRSDTLTRTSHIATVPIGYADGIFRAVGNGKLACLVNERFAPTVGRICMDMLMLDVTEIPDVREGDDVVLFGRQGEAFQSVKQVAKAAETIPYEILARISERVRRVFAYEG